MTMAYKYKIDSINVAVASNGSSASGHVAICVRDTSSIHDALAKGLSQTVKFVPTFPAADAAALKAAAVAAIADKYPGATEE